MSKSKVPWNLQDPLNEIRSALQSLPRQKAIVIDDIFTDIWQAIDEVIKVLIKVTQQIWRMTQRPLDEVSLH